MNQKQLNNFKRKHFNLSKRIIPNIIVHDSNTSKEHRRLVNEVCNWLTEHNFTYYTRVYTQWGEIIDIVAPGLPRPMIEIRHSELKKDKKYDKDYEHMRIYIDTSDPFKLL